MSSRLFTEVREKRGLCYSVYASYETFKDRAAIVGYAGHRPELAQETLDRDARRVPQPGGRDRGRGTRPREGRAEIVADHAAGIDHEPGPVSIASDWYFLGRVRPLDEIQAAIDGLTSRRSRTTCGGTRRRT